MSPHDVARKYIRVVCWVKLSRTIKKHPVHPEYRKICKHFAGSCLQLVEWDTIGYAWLNVGKEVLSVEPRLLRIVRQSKRLSLTYLLSY